MNRYQRRAQRGLYHACALSSTLAIVGGLILWSLLP